MKTMQTILTNVIGNYHLSRGARTYDVECQVKEFIKECEYNNIPSEEVAKGIGSIVSGVKARWGGGLNNYTTSALLLKQLDVKEYVHNKVAVTKYMDTLISAGLAYTFYRRVKGIIKDDMVGYIEFEKQVSVYTITALGRQVARKKGRDYNYKTGSSAEYNSLDKRVEKVLDSYAKRMRVMNGLT